MVSATNLTLSIIVFSNNLLSGLKITLSMFRSSRATKTYFAIFKTGKTGLPKQSKPIKFESSIEFVRPLVRVCF